MNEILAKRNAKLANLVEMMMSWVIGPVAYCADISQLYNSIQLDEKHWAYQQIVWFDGLDSQS